MHAIISSYVQYRGGWLYHNSLTNSFLLPTTRLPALHRPKMILLILQHHLQQAFQLILSLRRECGSPIHRTAIANQISRICSLLLMVSGISFQSCLSAIGQIPDGDHPMFCVPARQVCLLAFTFTCPECMFYESFKSRTQLQSFVRAVFTILFKLTSEK